MALESKLIDKCSKCGKDFLRDRRLIDTIGSSEKVLCEECAVPVVEYLKEEKVITDNNASRKLTSEQVKSLKKVKKK